MIKFLTRKRKFDAIKDAQDGQCCNDFTGNLEYFFWVWTSTGECNENPLREIRTRQSIIWVRRVSGSRKHGRSMGWAAYRLADPLVEAVRLKTRKKGDITP